MAESKSASVVFTNGSLLANNAQASANSAKSAADNAYNLANDAQRTADGKNSIYRGSDPSTVPTANLKVGDLYFTDNAVYTWNGGSWEETVSDTTGKEIHAKVEKAMAEKDKAIAELKNNVEAKVKDLDKEIEETKIKTGNALNFYKEQYYLSNSYTELTGGSWSDEVPTKTAGKYVWSRYVTANVGDPTNQQYSDPVCISGLDGKDGATGATGPQGVAGPKGADGQTTYVHVAYANSADGSADFSVNYFDDALYIGVLTDYTQADSTDYTQYTWSRLKGDTGDQGIPGPKGTDGRTTYVHFAYANSADGTIGFDVSNSDGKLYIGQYTDYTQADSTNPASYRWTKIKGDTGATGPQGPKGEPGQTGFFIGTTPPPNPTKGTVWATADSSGNMTSAKTWDGSAWVSTAFTQDLVAGNITASKIVGGTLDVNKITIANAQNIPITSTVSLGDKLSNIEQNANGISTTVSNLHAGDRNLARGVASSKDWFVFQGFNNLTNYWWDLVTYSLDTLKAGDKVTFGITMKNEGVTSGTMIFMQRGDVSQWTRDYSSISPAGNVTDFVPNGAEKALTYTIAITDGMLNGNTSYTIDVRTDNVPAGGKLSFRYAFVKKGTLATDWTPAPEDVDDSVSQVKQTADSINAYVKGSKGSDTLKAILSMDPDHSSIAQVVNGQIAAAIGTYSDGTVRIDGKALHINADTKIEDATIKSAMIDSIEADKITTGTLNADHVRVINLDANSITTGRLSGKNIELNGQTTIHGQLNLLPTEQREEDQSIQGFHNAWHWRDSNVFAGNGGLQLQSTIISQQYSNDNTSISGLRGGSSAAITTLAPTYLKFTLYPSWNDVKNNFSNQLTRTYIDAGRIETNDVWVGNFRIKDSKMHGLNDSLYVTNWNGTNFDNAGSVGFQVWSGIGLGRSTIYTPTRDLYIQIGNVGPGLGAPYSSSGKVNVHCNRVISQRANTVSSRLSVKTDITPVSYDRALAAVEGTEMYDYRYISDDSGQHYVSGIIDDVNPEDPQYHMDDMLINKERTARIDANLVGYHHVILQELLKKIDELEIKLKSLETILKEK